MDTYKSFESSYGSDSGVDLLDAPVETARSGLDDKMLDEIDTVVTKDQPLARDYKQHSGE